ncbi:MAG: saccharopine dehydrogenase NADP-binding domain-containing protein [Gammaproteobacteria bacterium]|nr:saccharopine dehydrogenase NADP-binding domain-containing protein [Gammaproteobacteria bacterium]
MQSEFDLVIYGATGFTGKLAAQYMMRPGIGDHLRVAIAGRNMQKLKEVQAECIIKPTILIADSTEPTSIDNIVQQTNVVLSFAGPFAIYGEPVIASCIKFGKDYLDITGETPFIHAMIKKYQQQALETGARLIPFSGFDSIPADLSVYLGLTSANNRKIHLDSMSLYYQIRGGFNGGTLASALNMAEQARGELFSPDTLIPDSLSAHPSRPKLRPYFEPILQRWTAPFFMGPINTAVVRRSAWLFSEINQTHADFQYEERLVMSKRFGYLKAILTSGILMGFGLVTANARGRRLLRRFGPKPGEGPSEAIRHQGFFRGRLVCRSHGQCKLIVSMEGKGDPGNEITVALACESARLAVEKAFLPGRKGFLTPTFAFGDPLIQRLKDAGFHFNTEFIS